ncbi:MAG TPA: Hsp20/alpha crystallin family protein, partial [Limnochordia bacterium]|nr:Hsp20/alpha crystallin family protein [Limnochordia bacterium]
VEVPGVEPGELDIDVSPEGVTLKGEVRREFKHEDRGVHRVERRYGSFQRSIAFPVPVRDDEAKAAYRNGILEIRAPKAQPRSSRKLRIEGESSPPPSHTQH